MGTRVALAALFRRGSDDPGRTKPAFADCAPASRTISAVSFHALLPADAELLVENGIGEADAAALYGFPPEAAGTLTVNGRRVQEREDLQVSPQAQFGALDDSYPPGRYAMAAQVGEVVVARAAVVKRGGRPDARLYADR